MGTYTPKLNLYKPTPVTETSGWGALVNAAFDILDEALLHSEFSASEGFLRKTGTDTYEAVKSNLSAGTNPTVDDDVTSGYAVGSIWLVPGDEVAFVCLDNTDGAALWVDISQQTFGVNITNGNETIYTEATL